MRISVTGTATMAATITEIMVDMETITITETVTTMVGATARLSARRIEMAITGGIRTA